MQAEADLLNKFVHSREKNSRIGNEMDGIRELPGLTG
jgi:hypothetical protein